EAWRRHLEQEYPTPEARAAFEHEVSAVTAVAMMIDAVEQLQAALGVSKAEIARRLGRQRPNVARLFADGANPTLVTWFELLDALGVSVDINLHPRAAGEALLQLHGAAARPELQKAGA